MSDIFTITYEEALENGIVGNMSKCTFDDIVDSLRLFVSHGEFFYYFHIKRGYCLSLNMYHDKLINRIQTDEEFKKYTIFKVDDFNNITKKQFYGLQGVYHGTGIKKILFIIKLQSYLKGEKIEDDLEKEIVRDQTIENLKKKIKHLKELNDDLKQKNTLLNKQLNQYDCIIRKIEKFKREAQNFLDKI